jgi:hypothetical protein
MIGWRGKLSPQVRSLLDREAVIPAQPAVVRARQLARARAALVAGTASRRVLESAPRPPRWAAAAVLACVTSAAAAAAAYQIGVRMKPVAPPVAVSLQSVRSEPRSRSAANPVGDPPAGSLRGPAPSLSQSLSRADAIREELRLLRQARAAVGREDFAAALAPLAELSRRFRDGRLAEEREALRVKALAGLGRTDEARRAAAAFEARFPRSVLLPAVSRMPASSP